MHGPRLTPEILLRAYAEGLFPMAERRGDPMLYWVSPEKRGIIPLAGFHVPQRLARTVRSSQFDGYQRPRLYRCHAGSARATSAPGREESWINDEILRLYTALHAGGHAHSIECWQNGTLAGGLYGVRLGAAFFGESMFSAANATPARWRWCIWWMASSAAASPCSTPSSSPRIWRTSAPSKSRANVIC